jgi:hypothetical protein
MGFLLRRCTVLYQDMIGYENINRKIVRYIIEIGLGLWWVGFPFFLSVMNINGEGFGQTR